MSAGKQFLQTIATIQAWAGSNKLAALSAILMVSVYVSCSSGAEQTDWQPVKSKAGIEVQQMTIQNSPFKATRGSMVSDARMFDVLAVLRDIEACPQWLHKCKSGGLIAENSDGEHIYYTVIDSPFLLKDRDTYFRSEVTYSKELGALHIELHGAEDAAPPVSRRVRVLNFKGRWQMERYNDQQIRLIYEVHMDPQIRAPAAVNATMATSVLETMRNVDRLARSSPYLNSDMPAGVKSLNAPPVSP